MDKLKIKQILEDVKSGKFTIKEAMEKLKCLPYQDIGFAKIDTHRGLRKGFPEVIFCEGKSKSQIKKIVRQMLPLNRTILATRVSDEIYQEIKGIAPKVEYCKEARAIVIGKRPRRENKKTILVITAGTADIPVAEEAALTAEVMGNKVERLYDVGIAGLHRLLDNRESLFSANVLIVVAGLEGALPGVVCGMVDRPVIAVPTSVGYGTNFQGLAPLLTMLNSCAPGIAVVNIDNGFGAGYIASLINQMR
ncbi:nickel pincer cofactor biosynthesis protein LarB [candidate division WOR-3 bacterium]|nr:nickel pincer cofactor biosynthesis protein LarB [candidate division WOR-3 bacterium]